MLLNIKKVYFIDDANCKDVDVEIFLGKIRFVHQQAESAEKLSSVIIEDNTATLLKFYPKILKQMASLRSN